MENDLEEMMKLKEWFARPSTVAFCAYSALCAAAFAFVFWGTWGFDRAPVSPDCPSTYAVDFASRWWADVFAGRGGFVPGDVHVFIVPNAYFWHELRFALPCFFAGLALAFYLRGRKLCPLAQYGAAAAYALTGYGVTLFSAGHLGWFWMWPYAAFAFGLADRAVRKGKWRNWALLGATIGWGNAHQPDIWLLLTLLAFAYGVWCIVRETRRGNARWGRWFAGVGVALAVMFAICSHSLISAATNEVASREKQIAGSAANVKDGKADVSAVQRWDFCTSWSLPPEDTLEFVVPDVHGGSSDPRVSPKNPYRGRIGQRMTIPEGRQARDPRTGKVVKGGDVVFMPYRQHTVYLGLLTVVLALVGAFSAFRRRWRGVPGWGDSRFWVFAAVVSYLLALGGFTPFYRLVYALPVGDLIRCPLKFMHLLEFCVCALVGFGVEALVAAVRGKSAALGRVGFFALVALCAVNAVDLARVDRRYLAVEDISFQRAPNEAAAEIAKRGGGATLVALRREEGKDVVAHSFFLNNVETVDDAAKARYVVASGGGLAENRRLDDMVKRGALKMVGTFGFSKQKGVFAAPAQQAAVALFENAAVPAAPPKPPTDDGRNALRLLSLAVTLAVVVAGLTLLRRKA